MRDLRGVPWPIVGLGLLLTALTLYGATRLYAFDHAGAVHVAVVQGAVFAVAAMLIWFARERLPGLSSRSTLIFVLGVAAFMRLVFLFAPPHSTDIYRYVWDGRVQADGINPYRYIPEDPALAHLREGSTTYPHINRRSYAPTIYPPSAQIVFAAVGQISQTVTMMKAAMLAFEALAIWAILMLLRARSLPPVLVTLYAWHPLPLWEIAGSGHVDIIGLALLLVALLAAERGHRIAAGFALGASVLAKFIPLALTPAIWRRWDWKLPAGFAAAAVLLYLPYLGAGSKIFGFLGGYVDEGGLTTGDGFLGVALLKQAGFGALSLPVFLAVAAAVLGSLALLALYRHDPNRPDLQLAGAITTAFMVLLSPPHAWYFVWLVPFLCFAPSPALLYLTVSACAAYRLGWPPSPAGAAVMYGPFLMFLTLEYWNAFSQKEARRGSAVA
jgi:alpha-1,6-mannosyltransferase